MNELEVIKFEDTKKKIAKGFINYSGIFVSVCLMFAVIMIIFLSSFLLMLMADLVYRPTA